jgi:hypothetical protein
MASAGGLVGVIEAVNTGNGVTVGWAGIGVFVGSGVALGNGVQVGGNTWRGVGVGLGMTMIAGKVGGGKGLNPLRGFRKMLAMIPPLQSVPNNTSTVRTFINTVTIFLSDRESAKSKLSMAALPGIRV